MILDFTGHRYDPNSLIQAGVQGVIRYVSGRAEKQALPSEVARDRAAGLKVGFIFESSATRAEAGLQAGRDDAKFYLDRVVQLGGFDPAGGLWDVCWFANDTDNAPSAVAKYAQGWAETVGTARSGCYGSAGVIGALQRIGSVRFGWRSLSTGWAHDPSAILHLLQLRSSTSLFPGIDCDINEIGVPIDGGGDLTPEEHQRLVNCEGALGRIETWLNNQGYAFADETHAAVGRLEQYVGPGLVKIQQTLDKIPSGTSVTDPNITQLRQDVERLLAAFRAAGGAA